MNPKKTKEKERRRARKLAEEAWEAANDQNLDLAEKIIRRAVATQPDNPVLWNDQGMVLALRSKDREAEEAFRAAISLAPTYAEPFANLANMQAKWGYLQEAVRLMEQAVQFAPQSPAFAERLEAYRALVEIRSAAESQRTPVEPPAPTDAGTVPVSAFEQTMRSAAAALNWADISKRLTRDGCVLIQALVAPATCAELRHMFDDDVLFAKTVNMDRDDFGRGEYRYFKGPIPGVVDGLRRAVYPHVAKIANDWQGLLNEAERFPEEWEDFRLQCQAAGQTAPTPILLKYGPDGFNALHRDLRGSVFFPIQMAVVLSPIRASESDAEGFRGGEFLLCDVPGGKKARRQEIQAGLGDTLLFCTRDRLVGVGGAYGLQPVKHGVNPITEGTRVVLGVPFHEYR
jgi:hypothetical protein